MFDVEIPVNRGEAIKVAQYHLDLACRELEVAVRYHIQHERPLTQISRRHYQPVPSALEYMEVFLKIVDQHRLAYARFTWHDGFKLTTRMVSVAMEYMSGDEEASVPAQGANTRHSA